MRRYAMLVAVLVVALAATVWATRARWSDAAAGPDGDFDYASAFESLDPKSTAPLFRMADVAGKTEDELRAALGPPESCETTLYSRRCRYSPGNTEVVFIDGKADWLTVNELGETPFDDALLGRIGLPSSRARNTDSGDKRWTGVSGLREVTAHGSDGRVAYIRIKVKS
ncbi:hypothetical protein [Nevskia sp.]|uniref:hypothetical protein n=1 Tax=Nevskia sp. TaxID=1929292 RepID=UPI0025E5B2A5|nr:hypothetical protein [Nevskia sp.]